jgi:peptide/nickel transport system substrate-binding protein
MKKLINRREFLRLSALTAVGTAAAACGAQATPAPKPAPTAAPAAKAPEPTKAPAAAAPTAAPKAAEPTKAPAAAAPASQYKEAPMLADLVKGGKLPAVDARLPKKPPVFKGQEGIGKYGGSWRRAFSGVSDRWGPTKLGDRTWAWFDAKLNIQPRLAESYQVSPDGKEWTFKIREGQKWSDGKDFTTDDIAWWYKYELQNKKITPSAPTNLSNKDKSLAKLDVADKFTFKFTFTAPKPLLIYTLSRGSLSPASGGATPSHYMKEMHEETTSDKDKLAATVKAKGFDSWDRFYLDFASPWYANPERPSLMPWLAKGALSKELFVMERNPYFFGVDEQGNQLPYIDKITHRLFENNEVKNLWVTNGEIDMQNRHMAIADLALYKSGEAKGDYKTFMGISAGHDAMQLNLSCKNKLLNEFFNNLKVRQAISSAINRDQINQLIYNGLLQPRQYSPLKLSPQYYEKASTAWIKYDLDTANKLLDEAGYSKKGADGIRLHKDGTTPISFIIEGTAQTGTPTEDEVLLISKDLAKVGIKGTYKYSERALYTQHYEANDIEAAWWGGDRTVLPLVPEAIIFRGVQPDRPWCPGWGFYYNNPQGQNAVQPPEGHWIYTIWKIWDEEIAVQPDPAKQTEAFKKILDIWAEQLPMIGVLGEQPAPIIVKNGFKGYLPGMPIDDTTGDEHLLQSETYYWDDPAKHTS